MDIEVQLFLIRTEDFCCLLYDLCLPGSYIGNFTSNKCSEVGLLRDDEELGM